MQAQIPLSLGSYLRMQVAEVAASNAQTIISGPKAVLENGAAERTRTSDPNITNVVLYQLSYCGAFSSRVVRGEKAERAFTGEGSVLQGGLPAVMPEFWKGKGPRLRRSTGAVSTSRMSTQEIAEVEHFHAMAISRLAHELAPEMAKAGRPVIHMEYGQPSTSAPIAAIAAAHQVLDNEACGYWESSALLNRIAQHYGSTYGVELSPEQIVLTSGASPALVLALSSMFAPGARVALARPGYVAYRNTLRTLYLEPVEMDCGPDERYQVTACALDTLDPPPDGLILASPANPTGTIIAPEEMAAIANVCRAKGIKLVSDEIYHGLCYEGEAQSALQHLGDAVVVNSFSKYYSMPGWRLGWLVVPPHLIGPARARMSNLFLTPSVLAQHAGLAALDSREELEGHKLNYRHNRAMMLAALPELGLREIAPPDGAFYIWADIGHLTNDSLDFCSRLLRDTGVATAPGIDFDPVAGNRFIRFSFAVSSAQVMDALARMKPWFAQAGTPGLTKPS